ncbi:MAG TPA: hypothetical protein VK906_05195 [Egicoccus sp.]|nr:hypothetical protein [Egicoccus sp.]HSK22547.1 hypothetical protein [Egicoccus sp.]
MSRLHPLSRIAAGLGALALAGGGLAMTPTADLEVTAPLVLRGHERVAELPAYGANGTTAVGYSDERDARVELSVRNRGRLPVTVHGFDPFPELLGMVEAVRGDGLPVSIAPGGTATLKAQVRFTNCEYYTERAVNRFLGATLQVERLGVTRPVEVSYPREVVLRSPTILGCPDRSTDRSFRQRMLARDE